MFIVNFSAFIGIFSYKYYFEHILLVPLGRPLHYPEQF